jgi:hypothetical protein
MSSAGQSKWRIQLILNNPKLTYVDPHLSSPSISFVGLDRFNRVIEEQHNIIEVLDQCIRDNRLEFEACYGIELQSHLKYEQGKKDYQYDLFISVDRTLFRRAVLKYLRTRKVMILTRNESRMLFDRKMEAACREIEGEPE